MSRAAVSVSIVSHGHAELVESLLRDLQRCPQVAQVILTRNIAERDIVVPEGMAGQVVIVDNPAPRGFAANHNAAFERCTSPYFCVLNPDITFTTDPFPVLADPLASSQVAFTAPVIRSPSGKIEDSARIFPTPFNLALRLLRIRAGQHPIDLTKEQVRPDWVAGMFMVFRADAYLRLRGFDEGYFLYCEDIDICWRARNAGFDFFICSAAQAIHAARRASRRQARYAWWHAKSMARFMVRYLKLA